MYGTLRIRQRLLIGCGILVLMIIGLSGYTIYMDRAVLELFQNVDRLRKNDIMVERLRPKGTS